MDSNVDIGPRPHPKKLGDVRIRFGKEYKELPYYDVRAAGVLVKIDGIPTWITWGDVHRKDRWDAIQRKRC